MDIKGVTDDISNLESLEEGFKSDEEKVQVKHITGCKRHWDFSEVERGETGMEPVL